MWATSSPPSVTSEWWVVWPVAIAAVLAAVVTIWHKAIKPIVITAQKIEHVFDLSEELPPSVMAMLLALPTRLDELTHRIDSHMENEEMTIADINSKMGSIQSSLEDHVKAEEGDIHRLDGKVDLIGTTLDGRTQLFDDLQATMQATQNVLTRHMAADEERFTNAQDALVIGQKSLLDRLARIETQTKTKGSGE